MALLVSFALAAPAHAASGAYEVVYEGDAMQLVSAEDDFFAHFDVMMPGDELTGFVSVSNDGETAQDIWFYANPLDAANRAEADLLLDEIELCIYSRKTGEVVYEGELRADGLNDPVHLGTFSHGDEDVLNFRLYVPAELGNEFAMASNAVNWVFAAEDAAAPVDGSRTMGEDSTGESQPQGGIFHKTGDGAAATALMAGVASSLLSSVGLAVIARRRNWQEA